MRRCYCFLLFLPLLGLLLTATPATALENVTLQLKWTHAFQFAGYYAAKEQGYYRAAGLEVDIVEATPTSDPVHSVLAGTAQFGVGTSSLILERQAGKPVVVLAVIFQQSPYEIYAAPGIRHLQDLIGKRLMLEPQADELLAYLKKEKIPLDRIELLPHSLDAEGLIHGQTEAIAGYVSNEPYYFKRAQFPYQTFSPRSAGIDFYGDNLFTSEQELRDHPARVKAFRAATLRGWQYAKEHRDAVIELILANYSRKNSRDFLRYESDQMLPLLQPNLIEIGYMNPHRWRHIADCYAEIGLLPVGYPLDGFLYAANEQDLSWFYRGLAIAALLICGITLGAVYIYRSNRRLVQALEQRQQADALLRQSETRFWRFFEDNCSVMLQVDPHDGQIVHTNQAARDYYGYQPDLVGMNIGQINTLPPDEIARQWQQVVDNKRHYFNFQHRLANGAVRDVEVYSTPVFVDEKAMLYSLVHDVTERKLAEKNLAEREALLQQIMDTSSVAIFLVAAEGRITNANRRMAEMFGWPLAELAGKNYVELIHPAERDIGHQQMEALLSSQIPAIELNRRYWRADGSEFWGHLTGRRLHDASGKERGLVGVIVDISERKAAETAIAEQIHELQRWQNVMLDREDRIQEIKREVNELCRRAGEPVRYPSQETDETGRSL